MAVAGRDPITAQGMSDAFRDVDNLAAVLGSTFSGKQSFEAALGAVATGSGDAQRCVSSDQRCLR